MNSVAVGIIGGTGYTGMELLRLLHRHSAAEVRLITSRSEAGKPVSGLFPSLRGAYDIEFSDPESTTFDGCDVVFSAAPNGVAMGHAPALIGAGIKMIDFSADFRLQDIEQWQTWYGMEHVCPELVQGAVYGLPEVNRDEIRNTHLVANPGCYPTAIQIGFLPLLEQGIVETDSLIADAKSGVSGAGRKANLGTGYSEVSESFKAYAVSGHRHLPEIQQGLEQISGGSVGLVFTPHLVPMVRGIHATLYARLAGQHSNMAVEELHELFSSRFVNEPFVDVMPAGSHPDTRSVRGSNHCRLAVHRAPGSDVVVVLVVEDNLVKGAAGQAIQNMNLMCGLDEESGLGDIALVP